MERPNQLDPKRLLDFDDKLAVAFLRRLLWAEARSVGIAQKLILVPQCINAGDGGIDAKVENANPSYEYVIPIGTTGFQAKAAKLSPAAAAKELHQNEKSAKPLKAGVVKLMDAGGTYILATFKSYTTTARDNIRAAIVAELKKHGYCNTSAELQDQGPGQ